MRTDIVKLATEIVTSASVLYTILPPWEVFDDFPRAQKYYKLFIYCLGYAALNGRSAIPYNKGISINSPGGYNTTGESTTTVAVPVEVKTTTEVKPSVEK